jgi:non-specific serine/threonine protein kinase
LEAAEEVCRADLGVEVFDGIASLVDKSLLRRAERVVAAADASGASRFAMLETIREYGRVRLAESGEEGAIHAAHAASFLRLAEDAEPELDASEQTAWLHRLEAEHDNPRAALAWTAGSGEAETALRLAGALWLFWGVRGHVREGRRWLATALATGGEAPLAVRAKALNAAGNLARAASDYEQATTLYAAGLHIWRQLDDQLGIAWAPNNLGVIARERGDAARAIPLCRESLACFRAAGYQLGTATFLLNLGTAARHQGEVGHARACFEEGLALARALGDEGRVAALQNLLARPMPKPRRVWLCTERSAMSGVARCR